MRPPDNLEVGYNVNTLSLTWLRDKRLIGSATIREVIAESEDAQGAASAPPVLTPALRIAMSVACGTAIANIYYSQPLLPQIARDLHATVRGIGILPTLTQVGFALGVFLLAPLGDVLERKRLVLATLVLVTLSLVAAAIAPNLPFLAVASFAIGITSVISTLVLPFAVQLSRPEERGATVGSIAGAMLLGVLLSRTLSGVVGGALGWRFMYSLAAVLMVVLALVLRKQLPQSHPSESMKYSALIRSMFGLIRTEPLLREATINGMLLYGALSTFWATLIFLIESPIYHFGPTKGPAIAGLFGLIGAGSALAAPIAGKLTDRLSPRTIVGWAGLSMLAGFVVLWAFGFHIWGLILGVILIDIAAQVATVSNQATVYSLAPGAHSRLYTVYRAVYSLGGSAGAYLGVLGWSIAGWGGVCGVAITMLVAALVLHRVAQRRVG